MLSFFLALILFLYFCKNSFFVQGSQGDTTLQYTALDDSGSSSSSDSDAWLLQPEEEDSSLLLGATINQKKENPAPNTDTATTTTASNFLSFNDKLLPETTTTTTTSETESSSGGLLLGISSNNDCRSSSTDDSTLESGRQKATQENPTKKRNIRGRQRRRRRRRGEDASKTFCPAPLLSPPPPPPSTQQTPNALENPSPQKKKKKNSGPKPGEEPQPNGDTQPQIVPPVPSTADLNWDKEMFPSLFRIPADGYSEGGYNPACITKTNGLLPLGICDSGDDEDRLNSMYDINGNPVDSGLFLDAVAFKLNNCRLGMFSEKKSFFFSFPPFLFSFSISHPTNLHYSNVSLWHIFFSSFSCNKYFSAQPNPTPARRSPHNPNYLFFFS